MTTSSLALTSALVVMSLLTACGDATDHKPPAAEGRLERIEAVPAPDRAAAPPEGAASGAVALAAPITEAELGVPLYPGAALLQPQSSRQTKADGSTVIGTFEVPDAPASVAAYYRDQLRAREAGTPVMETKTDAGQVLIMLNDTAANRAVQVEIGAAGKGARVQVTAVQFPTR